MQAHPVGDFGDSEQRLVGGERSQYGDGVDDDGGALGVAVSVGLGRFCWGHGVYHHSVWGPKSGATSDVAPLLLSVLSEGVGRSGAHDVVFGAEGELRDVLGSVLTDHQDVVLTVAAGAGLAVHDRDHRFHGDHHAGLEHGVDVLAEFQPGLAAVVVAQDAEGVSVAERPVREQSVADVDLVQLGGDVLADRSGLDEFQAAFVDFDVDVPQFERAGVGFAVEQGAFQGGVVAGGHREAVQGQDVVFLDLARGGPVVGAVGVDAGLEPHPGVTDFRVREGPGDLVDHGFGADQRDLVFGDAGGDGVADGLPAQVADPGTVLDHLDLFGRLDHPLAHGRLGHVHQGGVFEGRLDLVPVVQRQRIVFDAKPARGNAPGAERLLDREDVVVPAPVRVHHVVAVAAPPRHAGVDVGRDRHGVVPGDHHGIGPAEIREEEVRVVLDGVVAGQDDGVQVLLCHDPAQSAKPALKLGVGERQLFLLPVVQDFQSLQFGDGRSVRGGDGHGGAFL